MISNIHKLREALLHSNFDFLSIWFVSFMCVFDFSMTSGRNFPLQRDNWQPSQVKWMQLAHTQGQHGLSPLLEKPATTPLHLCISYSINLPFLAWLFRFVFQTMPSCQSYWFECATYVCHVNAFERPLTPTFGRPHHLGVLLSCLRVAINEFSLASAFLLRFCPSGFLLVLIRPFTSSFTFSLHTPYRAFLAFPPFLQPYL